MAQTDLLHRILYRQILETKKIQFKKVKFSIWVELRNLKSPKLVGSKVMRREIQWFWHSGSQRSRTVWYRQGIIQTYWIRVQKLRSPGKTKLDRLLIELKGLNYRYIFILPEIRILNLCDWVTLNKALSILNGPRPLTARMHTKCPNHEIIQV